MASEGFQFKQFYIRHDRCAMKVGTDGVLLGSWVQIINSQLSKFDLSNNRAPLGLRTINYQLSTVNCQLSIVNSPIRVLDVGTGSGLIARMLMQRYPETEVEAIDVDEAAVCQARENGVSAFHARLQDWQIVHRTSSPRTLPYDLIVSNPPYFQNSLKNPDKGRQTARHTDSLSYEDLILHSARLLTEGGTLALILPAESEKEIVSLAEQHSLYLTRVTRVYSKKNKPARRVLLQFEKSQLSPINSQLSTINYQLSIVNSLVLENEKGGRSDAYQELTKDFYL